MVDSISGASKQTGLFANSPDKAEDVQAYLLAHNPSLQGLIKYLLAWKYCDCGTSPEYHPKNCYETAAFVTGLDYVSRRRDRGGDQGPIMDEQDKISEMLAARGYQKVVEIFPFLAGTKPSGPEEVIVGVNPSAVPKNLKTGDLVLVGGHNVKAKEESPDRFVHAMIYLGNYRGDHYVFQKPDYECGPRSPYQIIPLATVLEQLIGLPTTYNNIYTDRVFVLRKF